MGVVGMFCAVVSLFALVDMLSYKDALGEPRRPDRGRRPWRS